MAAPDLQQYLDERGTKILEHEHALRELGLLVETSRVGRLSPTGVSGGVLDVVGFDQFKKRDEKFSEQLVDFLRDKIGLSPGVIARLEQDAVLSPEEFGFVLRDSPKITLELIPASTDPPLRSSEYQADLRKFSDALQATHAKVSFRMFMQEAVGAQSFLLGGFTIEDLKSVALVIGPIIGAWVQARYGRKVRLKIGDVEAEARTVTEVEELLKRAEALRRTPQTGQHP